MVSYILLVLFQSLLFNSLNASPCLSQLSQSELAGLAITSAPIQGDGSPGNPYQIENLDQLAWIAESPSRWGFHYAQAADIDALSTSGWYSGAGWAPIGNGTTAFTGSYDGRGHIIKNLHVNRPAQSNIGLFGVISGSVINHLHIKDANVTGGNDWTGILAGQALNGSIITHCYTYGTVHGVSRVGGLIGFVTSSGTLVTQCGSAATVTGENPSSSSMYLGGLIGLISSSASVTESFATGNVTGRYRVGGLIGSMGWNALAENCYASGNVTVTNVLSQIGGLVGEVWQARIRLCYSTGFVNYGSATSDYGGLVGTKTTGGNYEDYRNYWNTQTSGLSTSAMGTGRTTNQMQKTNNYSNWNFINIWALNSNYNNGFPYLMQPGTSNFDGGNGSPANPYLISNIFQLQAARLMPNTSHYLITSNFGAHITEMWNAGLGFDPIGYYNGTIDGDDHVISGLVINRPSASPSALITQTGSNAIIRNLTLNDVNITGGSRTAGLVGTLEGIVENVSVSGTLTGGSTSGGLVGQVNSSGSITDCHTNVVLNSTGDIIGGLVGYNNGATITSSSSSGEVTGRNQVGGLIGKTEGSVTSCHSGADVTATGSEVGGLIGWNNNSEITYCQSSGTVEGINRVGGLIGYSSSSNALISNCNSSSDVTGVSEVGGLIGFINDGTIELTFTTGTVNGTNKVGGLVGFAAYGGLTISQSYSVSPVTGTADEVGGLVGRLQDGDIEDCFARGPVEGSNYVGGLIGSTQWGSATITNTYSTGEVTGTGPQTGGLIGGRSQSAVNNSYWDIETSGLLTSNGGTGLNTAQMLDQLIYSGSGWDLNNIWSIDPVINDGYPFLIALGAPNMLVWTGNIDTVWEKSGNWSINRLPGVNDNIIIPNVTNKPVLSSSAEVKGISIQPNSKLTINHNGNLKVILNLSNNNGINGLVVISNTSGTGSLIHNSSNVPATFQRYIPGSPEAWHSLSSPMVSQAISPEFTPPGTYGDGTGYDLYHWHEPDTSWIYFNHPATWSSTHGSSNFIPARGYLVAYQASNPTRVFSGNLNNGSINIPVTRSAGISDEFGFNLIGNPYPSSIDWKAASGWGRTPLEVSAGGYNIWIWNDTAYNYGVYNSSSVNDLGTLGTGRYIAPTQGFFVKAAQTGSITTENSIRVHNGSGNWLRESGEMKLHLSLLVTSADGYGSDQIKIEFGYISNEGGALKKYGFIPSAPSLFIPVNDNEWSLRMLSNTYDHPVIPVSFRAAKPGKYNFSVTYDKYTFTYLVLEDLKTGKTHDLLSNPRYVFNAEKKDDEERFVLKFREGGFANPHLSLPANLYTSNKTLYADLRLLNPDNLYQIRIFDLSGKLVFSFSLKGGTVNTFHIPTLNGVYISRVTGEEGVLAEKLFW